MLSSIPHDSVRHTVGNRSFTAAGLAIHGSNTENVLTANAVTCCIDGVFNTLAAQTEIDINGLTFYNENGETNTKGVTPYTGVVAVPAASECKFVLAVNASDTIVVCQGNRAVTADVTAGTAVSAWPKVPAGFAPFGGVKVVNGSSADFTLGATDLDATGITDTYYDLSVVPA